MTLRIAFVSSEIAPFAKTGGLADVSQALGQYLGENADLRLFMPLYRRIRDKYPDLETELADIPITFAGSERTFSLVTTTLPDSEQRVTFIDCPEYFDRADIYSQDEDEPLRFAFLSEASLVACQYLQFLVLKSNGN